MHGEKTYHETETTILRQQTILLTQTLDDTYTLIH